MAADDGETYAAAGVDIAAGEAAVEAIKGLVSATHRPGVVGGIGGFGGVFDLTAAGHAGSLLVSSTDGVGTKAMVAAAAGRYDTIGIDLVAMCVDDLVCVGAEPLFLLDYISVGRLDPAMAEALVAGVAEGCRQAGCALIGGEMAEHPGAMADGEFDLVGFAVGAVERHAMLGADRVRAGDVLVGLHSPGLRSNGYSLARRLLFDVAGRGLGEPAWDGAATSVADELLRPSVVYAPAVLALARDLDVHAVAHITGGGIPGNLDRVLPGHLDAVVDPSTWQPPAMFAELARIGRVTPEEMARTFNMGVGMIAVVAPQAADAALALLDDHGHGPAVVGEVVAGGSGVVRST